MKQTIDFLGHTVSSNGIQPQSDKINAIAMWPTPKNVQDVRSFLELANFYRRFVPHFGHIAAPLSDLTRRNGKTFNWTEKQQRAFEDLKRMLTSSPILIPYNPDSETQLRTDASERDIGAVMEQRTSEKELWRLVAFTLRRLSRTEEKYSTRDKELLAIKHALKEWQHYLQGGKHFQILTDHELLKHLQSQPTLSRREARWIEFLAEFDMEIRYAPGITNQVADALSRYPIE
jgi:hypothetical protein